VNYALCSGINDYPGTGQDLGGCLADAEDVLNELDRRKFSIRTLFDRQFTRDLWLEELRDLVAKPKRNELAVAQWSSHGTWVADVDGDEADGRDEAICPYDYATAGVILDDEIAEICRDCKGTVLLWADSCHSGTVSRDIHLGLPHSASTRFLPPETVLGHGLPLEAARKRSHTPVRRRGHTAILVAGCRDAEYCYDAVINGKPNGAFTRAALDALKTLAPGANYLDWYRAIRKQLPSAQYPQTPQITATRAQLRRPVLT
jgi:metacaspase-1